MRILYQCNSFLPTMIGGVEVLSYHLVRELLHRGHQVLVLTECRPLDQEGRQMFDGIDLVRIRFDSAMAQRSFAAMRRASDAVAQVSEDFRPDILHLNDTGLGSLFFLRGGATGHVPRVLTLHSPIRPAGRLGLQGRLARDVDRVAAVSDAMCTAALAAIPDVRGKISAIRNALPMPDPAPAALPFEPTILLCLGRIIREKGFDTAVRAFAMIRDRGLDARLVIAGDGDERDNLRMLANQLGVAEQVTLQDWVRPDRVPQLINDATLVLVPSRWPEPFGLVALQAAQMGRPVIASAIGGLAEIVDHGKTGLLVPPRDDLALADAIQALVSDLPAARQMGAAARKRACEAFDFNTFVDAYERLYQEALTASDGEMVA